MKNSELNLPAETYHSLSIVKDRTHYKRQMRAGFIFPTTKIQAKSFIIICQKFDSLSIKDVDMIEELLNKHGFEGDYKRTKSKRWARLENIEDFYSALKSEYSI